MVLEIILGICVLALSYLFYRQDRVIKGQVDYIEKIENKMLDNHKKISNAFNAMKVADGKGGFESDDEVGQVFNQLKTIIQELQKELKGE